MVHLAVSSINRDRLSFCYSKTHSEEKVAVSWQNETIIVREMQSSETENINSVET